MTQQHQHEEATAEAVAPEAFDPHRFSAEPKRKSSKTVLIIAVAFVIVMAFLGATVLLTKNYLATMMAERAERKKEEKELKQAEVEAGRKGKIFGKLIGTVPSESGAVAGAALPGQDKAALPGGFGKGGPADKPDLAIPVLTNGGASSAAAAPPPPPPPPPPLLMARTPAPAQAPAPAAPPAGLFGAAPGAATGAAAHPRNVQELAQQQSEQGALTATPQANAVNLGNRSLLLARGAFIPCVLETQLISNIGGSTSCVVPQNIYSDDGKVVLIERGSSIAGLYQSNVRSGDTRIAILWQRIKTSTGVVIDVDSPAADQVGVIGAPGVIDNHWPERIGAAFLLSLVEDAVAIQVAKSSRGNNNNSPAATVTTSTTMSEKVLDSTINIAPTLYKNRGERLMVFVNRDLWFTNVYSLKQVKR